MQENRNDSELGLVVTSTRRDGRRRLIHNRNVGWPRHACSRAYRWREWPSNMA
jgi:hypothetical protein